MPLIGCDLIKMGSVLLVGAFSLGVPIFLTDSILYLLLGAIIATFVAFITIDRYEYREIKTSQNE